MGLGIDDIVKGAAVPAVLAGLGLAAAAPFLMHKEGGKPVAKALLHKYLDLADKLHEMTAETQEQWRDLLAEVQAEREARRAAAETEEPKVHA